MQQLRNFLWTLTAGLLLVLLAGGAIFGLRQVKTEPHRHFWDTATVIHEVQSLADLVTVKYVLDKVVVLEDVKWYGESRLLLLAHGVVKAGLELRQMQPADVTIVGKKISLRLPPAQITDVYLDDHASRVIDHTTGLLRSFDKDLEQAARLNAVQEITLAARQGNILQEANQRGQTELENFFKQAGFEQVEFR